MKTRLLAAIAALFIASPACAQLITAPIYRDSAGNPQSGSVDKTLCSSDSGSTWVPCAPSGGGGGGSSGGTATAATPTYTEGATSQPLSLDLSGRLRTLTTLSGTLPAYASIPAFKVDQTTPGTTDSFTPKATESHLGQVGGTTIIASANFTTPSGTTAYASGQLIANSATAGSVTPLTFAVCRTNANTGMVRRIRLKTTDTGFTGLTVYVKLYRDTPTLTNGDHGTWLTTESNYLGTVSVSLDQHFSDAEKGVGVPTAGSEINFDCASGSSNIYGLVVATSAVTPQGAKVFTAVAEVLAN